MLLHGKLYPFALEKLSFSMVKAMSLFSLLKTSLSY